MQLIRFLGLSLRVVLADVLYCSSFKGAMYEVTSSLKVSKFSLFYSVQNNDYTHALWFFPDSSFSSHDRIDFHDFFNNSIYMNSLGYSFP